MEPLDPQLLAEVGARAKGQLRARMKAMRKAYPSAALAERSARIVERVAGLSEFASAGSVALFWPVVELGEVDVRPLDELARAANKRVYYPGFRRLPGGELTSELRLTAVGGELVPGEKRFLEPLLEAPVAKRGEVELIVVPALAAALSGHRLGFGLGFYDTLLPDFRPPARAVVVVFDFQMLAELPTEPHDAACDLVVSDARTVRV